jgi:hypothetical protein
MSLAASLFAPLALLLPAAGAVEPVNNDSGRTIAAAPGAEASPNRMAQPADGIVPAFDPSESAIFQLIAQSFVGQTENQVRIEQRVTIRIAPRRRPVQPSMLMDLPSRPLPQRLAERDIGRCLPVSGIAGVQISNDNRLILFMRDRRIVSAALERACNARDFYSGFYVERNSDGQICVRRDSLLSRSGANCKLTRMRQLVQAGN